MCRKADHSRANVRASKETSRTLGLSIANLIINLEQLKIYNEIYSETEKRLKNIETALNLLQPSLDELNQKLSEPTFRRNIQLAAHNILCQNFVVRENLNKATEKLNMASEKLQEKIFQPSKLKNIFTLKEIYDIFRRQYFGLKKEQEKYLFMKKFW